MPKQVQLLFEAAWILALAYFIAYLETVAISNVCDNIHQYHLSKLLMNFAFHLSGALSVINVLGLDILWLHVSLVLLIPQHSI